MNKIILSIYDYLHRYPARGLVLCIGLTLVLFFSILTLHYKEDISDFLPLDSENQTALSVYQEISGANKIYALIGTRDTTDVNPEVLVDGVDSFITDIETMDSMSYISGVVKRVDLDAMLAVVDEVYENIPYFLTESDYARMDSLLGVSGYISDKIDEDKQLLLFPSSNVITSNIARDPLNLFGPVLKRLSGGESLISYQTYDGYILSPDEKRAIVILESSFGANESENNAKLVKLLTDAVNKTESENPDLDIHLIGGPIIAVGNANRIKSDSVLTVVIAGILILALLIYVFRDLRNILLILVSVGWGWLFAMGVIGLFYSSVSIIVIGIASVVLGIAVNYPLHLIDHLKDSDNPRLAYKEIIAPLVVGNVTTVGAFLCLVPLNAPALHDLGLFASLLLIGTILFVLVFLPHAVKIRPYGNKDCTPALVKRLTEITLENNKWIVILVVILTGVFGYFSFRTEFDSDMRNINYMTPEQKADMALFQSLISQKPERECIYVVSSGPTWDDALMQNEVVNPLIDSLVMQDVAGRRNRISDFFTSKAEQSHRIKRWNDFVETNRARISSELSMAGQSNGFSENAFDSFYEVLNRDYDFADIESFDNLFTTVFGNSLSRDKTRKSVVQTIEVDTKDADRVKSRIKAEKEFGGMAFDVRSMNGAIADTLSSDFNYIGIVCGFIVFIFLWISLGSIELAIVSFLPMAVSWIWILGIMGILGLKFNIVNVILATFIFGQGDDYTIFMTEGLSYELAYRRKLLASYKSSIIVSALIMFIGIGTLVFSGHPALKSLGEVTVVGMLSVVLMAYLFPPLVFNWLVRKNGRLRPRPITLKKILCTGYCAAVFLSQLFSAYILGFFLLVLTKPTDRKRLILHRYCCSVFRWDVKRMPGLGFRYVNPYNESFSTPAVIISNHQSLLDSFYLMTLTPKMVMIANDHVGTNIITGRMFRWLGFITVGRGIEQMIEDVRPYVLQGYSVALFPEGERPRDVGNTVRRFHKGMISFANALNLDILPVFLHGIAQTMPKGSAISNGGEVVVEVDARISKDTIKDFGETIQQQTRSIRQRFQARFIQLCHQQSTVALLKDTVYDRYRYKGAEIERKSRRALRDLVRLHDKIEGRYNGRDFLVINNDSQGELALMLSLIYPDRTIYVRQPDSDARRILEGCMNGFVTNIHFVSDEACHESENLNVFDTSDLYAECRTEGIKTNNTILS